MVGRRKGVTTSGGGAHPSVSMASATATAAAASGLSSSKSFRMQWIPRLEYSASHGGATHHDTEDSGQFIDATTTGIEYSGYTIQLRIKDDGPFNNLLDRLEEAYRKIESEVVSLSLIVECNVVIRQEDLAGNQTVILPVKIERTRPDKHTPNSYLTITRTITSILQGVTIEHLRRIVV